MKHTSLISCLMGLLLVAAGCGRKSVPSVTTTVFETHEREIPRLVEVSLPGYELGIRKVIECDSNTNKPKPFSIAKTTDDRRAGLAVQLTDQAELIATCKEDSLKQVIQVKDREIERLKETTVEVPVYKTRKIDIVCRWIAGGVVVLIAGKIGLKYINPFT